MRPVQAHPPADASHDRLRHCPQPPAPPTADAAPAPAARGRRSGSGCGSVAPQSRPRPSRAPSRPRSPSSPSSPRLAVAVARGNVRGEPRAPTGVACHPRPHPRAGSSPATGHSPVQPQEEAQGTTRRRGWPQGPGLPQGGLPPASLHPPSPPPLRWPRWPRPRLLLRPQPEMQLGPPPWTRRPIPYQAWPLPTLGRTALQRPGAPPPRPRGPAASPCPERRSHRRPLRLHGHDER